jgi:hypothetical protein
MVRPFGKQKKEAGKISRPPLALLVWLLFSGSSSSQTSMASGAGARGKEEAKKVDRVEGHCSLSKKDHFIHEFAVWEFFPRCQEKTFCTRNM